MGGSWIIVRSWGRKGGCCAVVEKEVVAIEEAKVYEL